MNDPAADPFRGFSADALRERFRPPRRIARPLLALVPWLDTLLLAGAFAFSGDVNGWEVTGVDNKRELATALFADATPATFQGLKNVKAVFNAKPKCAVYYFAGEAPGITNDDVADATVTVTDGEKDYSGKFKLVVRDGRLALANASPGGMAIFLR